MIQKLLLILTFIAIGFSLRAQTPAVDSIYSENIKTVILGKQGVEMSLPIIQLGSNERLMLRFDELGNNSNYYRYRIDHCTHDWQISDISVSDYMDGFEDGAIDNQQFSFTTIEHYTNYWQTIPNDMSSFAASGNYLLTVYLQSDPDSIVFTRRFKVFEPLTVVEATVGRVQGSVGLMENQNLSVKVNPLEGNYFINPDAYMFVYAEQNGRTDLTRLLPLESMSGNTLNYRWKKENVFPGGNEFRFFDFSNLQIAMNNVWKIEYFGGENIVYLKPDENRSRNVYSFEEGLNGQYKIAGTDVYVTSGRAVDINGTLAGSTLTMFRALKNFMKFCNIPLSEALKYATVNPAKMVNADFVGRIAKCYRADFIIISDINDPEIDSVYVGGYKVN